jgi:hypothetical protein
MRTALPRVPANRREIFREGMLTRTASSAPHPASRHFHCHRPTAAMGRHSIFVSSTPLPLTAVKLGRLVEEPKSPDRGFFDPTESLPNKPEPRSDTTNINNISRLLKAGNGSGLELSLTALASTWFKGKFKDVRQLKAETGRQSLLLNSTEWFSLICESDETRLWLEKAASRGRKTYLVTGLETLTKLEVSIEKSFKVETGAGIQAPVLSAAGLPIATPVDPAAKVDYSIERCREDKYHILDERVFSVRYREIKLKKSDTPGKIDATPSSKIWWEPMMSDRTVEDEDELEEDSTDYIEADMLDGMEKLPVYHFEQVDEEEEDCFYEPLSANTDAKSNFE